MGSSCTTAKQSASKKNAAASMNKYQNNEHLQNALFAKKNGNAISKETFQDCFIKNNKTSNVNALAQPKGQMQSSQKYVKNVEIYKQNNHLGDDLQTNQKEISPQSTNCPNMLSCNTSLKFESPKTTQHGLKTSPSISRRKISYIEIFILERKRYMQEKGVYNYTPYTVLPAPKLKKIENNLLFKRRKSSLAHIPSCVISNDNGTLANAATKTSYNNIRSPSNEYSSSRKENSPAQMPKGDSDMIKIEI